MWISKREYESLVATRSELAELGEALIAILPDRLKPNYDPFPLLFGEVYDFQAILDAAEAVKRDKKHAGDKELLKIVKAMKGKA